MKSKSSQAGAHVLAVVVILAATGVLYAATYRGAIASADEMYMFGVTHNLAEHGSIALDDLRWLNERVPGGANGSGGHFYTKLGLGQSMLGLPFYRLGVRWLRVPGDASFAGYQIGPLSGVRGAMAAGSVAAALVVLGAYVLSTLLGAGPRGSALAALATGAGSMLWPYAKTYFSEPTAALGIVWAMALLVSHGRRPALWKAAMAGLLLDVAVVVRPFNLAVAAPMVLFALWALLRANKEPDKAAATSGLVALVIMVAGGAAAVGAYDSARFGSVLATGYGTNEGFHHDVAQGLLGFAVSPGKSIVLFDLLVVLAPVGAVIAWRAGFRPEVSLLVVVCALYAVVYSAWWAWEGGWAWGPRFLLPVVPLLMALAATVLDRLPAPVAFVLVVVGAFVPVAGALYDPISAIGEVVGSKLPEAQYPWSWQQSYVRVQIGHVLLGDKPDSLYFARHAIKLAWLALVGVVAVAAAAASALPARR